MAIDHSATELPRLDAFDQEFGHEGAAVVRRRRRSISLRPLTGAVLALIIVGIPVLAWLSTEGSPTADGAAEVTGWQSMNAQRAAQRLGQAQQMAEIEQLRGEVAALKQQIGQLTAEQQDSAQTIAALKVAEEESRPQPVYWYSDLAALSFQAGAGGRPLTPPGRHSAVARPEQPRDSRRRETPAPLSLEAPQ